jgi:pimeloyl-ACP methyl ester carboxylesterase
MTGFGRLLSDRLPRRGVMALAAIVAGIALAAATSDALREAASRRLVFRVWRAVSPEAHGGRYVAVNDIRIYYETYGSGPPVLVLHGGLGSLEAMHHQIRALAARRQVIAPDSRGHGRSTDSDAPLSYRLMADDMVKLLEALQLPRVDVVGWSDGGIIGLDLAMRHPERVGRLVVIGANFNPDGLKELPAAAAEAPPRPGFYRRNAPDPAHWPVLYRKVVTMWRTQPQYTPEDLSRIRAPTLVIAGEFDIIRPDHTDQLAKAIPGAEEAIIKGGTHLVPSQKPDIVNDLIASFLDRSPP